MRYRTITVKVMLNEKEYQHLEQQVAITGLNKSTLLRKLIMDLDIKPRLPDEYLDVYRLVANISNNVNQIAHVANATGYLHHEQITAITLMIEKCWKHIKELR